MNYPRFDQEPNKIKKFWKWLWESPLFSWATIVLLILIFLIIKFIFLPGLGLIFHASSLPLAIVESSSMDHYSLKECTSINSQTNQCAAYSSYYVLCGNQFQEKKFFSFDDYWTNCGEWYEQNPNPKINITKSQFETFKFKNGFRKGDIMILWGWKTPKIGNVLVFNAGRNHPIIHRIISISESDSSNNNEIFQTKGDHNPAQLSEEKSIQQNQVIGIAVGRIPYAGWLKLFAFEHPLWFAIILILILLAFSLFQGKDEK
jgi:signal peptidase I